MTDKNLTVTGLKINQPGALGGWDKAGLILQAAGMMGNLINSLYQTSQGRNPLQIGTPFVGLGQMAGGIGEVKRKDKMRSAINSMLGSAGLPAAQAGMLQTLAIDDPSKAMEKGIDVMSKGPSMTDIYMKAGQGDPNAIAALEKYKWSHPFSGPIFTPPDMRSFKELIDIATEGMTPEQAKDLENKTALGILRKKIKGGLPIPQDTNPTGE